jgi:PAS domain S-box-containing protein
MANRPAYEELVQRIKELEKETAKNKKIYETLRENEERFRILFNNMSIGVALVDREGYVLTANKADCQFLGYSQQELKGMHFAEFTYAEDLNLDSSLYAELVKGVKENYSIDKRYLRKDGKIVWGRLNVSVLKDSTEEPLYTIISCEDIDNRKRSEKALRKIKERYVLATKAAKVGVWDWNVQTNQFYIDPNVKAILGYSDAEIPNDIEVWSNYVHPDDKQAVMEAFQDHIDGKTPEFAYEHRMLHKDGSIRWIMVRGSAICDDQGSPVRVVGTDTDITDWIKAKEALREKDIKLEQQSKNLTEMNTALKVLLEQREKEKTDIKENLLANLKKLLYPYIEKLEQTKLNQDAQTFVNIIKSNMNDLISPFVETLSSKYFSLTPSEIQIADLIKHGKTSKEIASILNVSPKAVSFHRGNLRKKLGLLNKKINLRTYLQAFPH